MSWLPWPFNRIVKWLHAIYRVEVSNTRTLNQVAIGVVMANMKLDRMMAEMGIDQNPPSQPGVFQVKVTGQVVFLKGRIMLTYAVVNIPAVDMSNPNNKDVAKRTLICKCGDAGETITLDVPGVDAIDEITDPGLIGEDGDRGVAAMTYADAAGNVSAPRVVLFELTDTVAPGQPGEFGVQATGQV